MAETPRMVGPPETGVLGVGCTTATGQTHDTSPVQDGLRQNPSTHTSPPEQSVLMAQALLQPTCCTGVGVSVGFTYTICVVVGVSVGVGVGVLVDPGVGVGVGVGVVPKSMAKANLHAGSTACGSACGTVGATSLVVASCWLVIYTMAPSPRVKRATRNKYQYFLKNNIC